MPKKKTRPIDETSIQSTQRNVTSDGNANANDSTSDIGATNPPTAIDQTKIE